jgi:hypothetical protein
MSQVNIPNLAKIPLFAILQQNFTNPASNSRAFMSKILCILLFLALAAFGQQQERIAIMGTVDNQDSIDFLDLSYLTDKLRYIAGNVLPKTRYGIMTQQSIVDRLGSMERMVKECKEATCLAELGRKISADYIAQGYVGRFSGKLTIKVELYNVGSGNLIGSIADASENLEGLLAVLESQSPKLFGNMPGVSNEPEKPVPIPPLPAPPEPVPVAKKECAKKFNINELAFMIEKAFPKQLKDCSSALAKNMALAASPFGKKTELKEPKAFMMECAIDGIKQKMLAGSEGYVKPVEVFVLNLLNAASAGGGLDVKKLSAAIGGMDIGELLNGIRKLASEDDCAVDEPYEPPAAGDKDEGDGSEGKEDKRKVFSWGLRGGFNFSHLYEEYSNDYYHGSGTYESTELPQFGLVFDWALSDWLHIQPGVMVIIKGANVNVDIYGNDRFEASYIEIPLLLSLKFSVLRINVGPYFGIIGGGGNSGDYYYDYYPDFGISTGLGFDIGRFSIFGFEYGFYIGMFYDYGLTKSLYGYIDGRSTINSSLKAYNRTLGFNLGVNFL